MGRAAPRPCQHGDGSDGNSARSTGKVTGSDNAEACCTRASRFRWCQFFGAWWSFLIFGWNSPDWVLNFWACVRIGAIPVLGNHFRPTEGPKVRIHLPPAASSANPGSRSVVGAAPEMPSPAARGARCQPEQTLNARTGSRFWQRPIRENGQSEDGLRVIAEALDHVAQTGIVYYEAELHRLGLAKSPLRDIPG